jgi:hypothetical protein
MNNSPLTKTVIVFLKTLSTPLSAIQVNTNLFLLLIGLNFKVSLSIRFPDLEKYSVKQELKSMIIAEQYLQH